MTPPTRKEPAIRPHARTVPYQEATISLLLSRSSNPVITERTLQKKHILMENINDLSYNSERFLNQKLISRVFQVFVIRNGVLSNFLEVSQNDRSCCLLF